VVCQSEFLFVFMLLFGRLLGAGMIDELHSWPFFKAIIVYCHLHAGPYMQLCARVAEDDVGPLQGMPNRFCMLPAHTSHAVTCHTVCTDMACS
jgi:hypothetical protein